MKTHANGFFTIGSQFELFNYGMRLFAFAHTRGQHELQHVIIISWRANDAFKDHHDIVERALGNL